MQRTVGLFLALAIVLGLAAQAQALPLIVVGTHNLAADTPGQPIDFFVTDTNTTPEIIGLLFSAMINDDLGSGPTITDLETQAAGMIFFGNSNTPAEDNPSAQLFSENYLTTGSNVVQANGYLARLMVDTSGVFSGDFPLALVGGAISEGPGDSTFIFADWDVNSALIGSIHIVPVPEPSSVVLGLMGVVGLGFVAIRKRRARRA